MAHLSYSSTAELLRQFELLSLNPNVGANREALEQELVIERAKIDDLARRRQFEIAEPLEIQQLQLLLALYGDEDERIMQSLENLSSFCFERGYIDKSNNFLDHVISLRKKVQGENHSATLSAISSKVANLQRTGRVLEAEQLGLRLLKACTEYLKPGDPATTKAIYEMTLIYMSKGDDENAAKLSYKSLQNIKQTTANDHIEKVGSKLDLSDVYLRQNRWSDACPLLESVLNIRRRTLGDGHILTIEVARQLEGAYHNLERWKDLPPIQLLIINALRRSIGNAHEEMLNLMSALSTTYLKLGAWKEAIEMTEDIIQIKKKKLSPDHPDLFELEFTLELLINEFPNHVCRESPVARLIYRPLNADMREIRLVHIKKSPRAGALQASLIYVPLDKSPSYEALSYVWGSMTGSKPLSLNGYQMDITHNLYAALLQLRSETSDRVLWIDAICINQEDLDERSEQVRQMMDIYSTAKRTLVWLGEAEADSDIAIKFFKEMDTHPSPGDMILNIMKTAPENPLFDALLHLFKQRAYWKRLWVVQEIACAKDAVVYCGKHSVSYTTMQDLYITFADAARRLEDYPKMQRYERFVSGLLGQGPSQVGKQGTVRARGEMPLLGLLVDHRNALCTDPRDRIYALLGLSSLRSSSHPGLKIDYSKPVSEVYRGAAQAVIDETGELDIICITSEPCVRPDTGHYRPRQPYLPTWAPDWNVYLSARPLYASYPHARASGDYRARADFSTDGTVLIAEGLSIAPVDYCSEGFEVTLTRHQDMIRCLLAWRLTTQAHLGLRPEQQLDERLDQFYRLITSENPDLERLLPHVKAWWQQWQKALLQRSVDAIEVLAYQKRYLQIVFDLCASRRLLFFESPAGQWPPKYKVGMCPGETKRGDFLCVLLGCKYPLVLRPQDGHYIFIGEALVPEYMKGRAIEEMADGTRHLQKFVIY